MSRASTCSPWIGSTNGHQPARAAALAVAADEPGPRLLLARPGSGPGSPASRDATEASALLDDVCAVEPAEWVYFNVEEVWSGFNLIAETVARGFRIEVPANEAAKSRGAVPGTWATTPHNE